MNFRKKQTLPALPAVQTAGARTIYDFPVQFYTYELFDKVRRTVPIIDAAVSKIIRLIGSFQIQCSDRKQQEPLEQFFKNVPVGLTGQSVYSFLDTYLDSLLVYGNAVGEIVLDKKNSYIAGLWNGNIADISVKPGISPMERQFFLRTADGESLLPYPDRILFSALKPPSGGIYGISILQGLPALADILIGIYQCIGQNFDRAGNIRYAVTYRPSGDAADLAFAQERAQKIADEWSAGMTAAKSGEIRDFVSVGDVDIKVIGAEGEMPSTEIPVRQLLEQMLSKLSVPPFLLGLNWSSTERMSKQQADILTSELEYYRRLLEPVISKIAETFLRLNGSFSNISIQWDNINLQDETELAQAALYRAQTHEIEASLN